jgi:hypothetical protein
MADCLDRAICQSGLKLDLLISDQESVMSHSLDAPITHEYRGHKLVVKFDWEKPNDDSPAAAHVLEEGGIPGLADTVAELPGPWPDYQSALAEAMAVAERWIDSQLP